MDHDAGDNFPTYAKLVETRGWSRAATEMVSDQDEPTSIRAAPSTGERYTEGAVLGVGGMGKVMIAHDARIGREVAIKQLHADRELAPAERARFLREARVQGQLEHPSIVPVYDIDERDGMTFFTMRRVIGRTLATILEQLRRGDPAATARFTQRELLNAFATVCLTIDYAHSRGVIHRDIKPANIMLGEFGEVYVLDWGIARLVRPHDGTVPAERLSMTGETLGTPLYMAPEQIMAPEVGPAADVFSLGAILFELLTLQTMRDPAAPFEPFDPRISVRSPRPIAPELETICVRATAGDQHDRYGSARALQEAVVRYLEGDRELEQRRQLAAAHATAAEAALARADAPDSDHERERGIAMRELMRALALDPTNAEHVATLGRIMSTPPRTMPPAVVAEMRASEHQLVRVGTRNLMIASLLWFLFLPLVMSMGVLENFEVGLILVMTAISATLAGIASRRLRTPVSFHLAIVTATLLAMVAVSRMYGPLIMMPTLITAFALAMMAHPSRSFRRVTLTLCCTAIAGPMLLELAGLLPSSYRFEGGRFEIVPQMHELPRAQTIALLLVASTAAMVVPCLFIGRLRTALSDAQRQLLLRSWHFRRLGNELVDAELARSVR